MVSLLIVPSTLNLAMRSLTVTALLVLGGANAFAQDLAGSNCLLREPPAAAGESQSHGALLRVFPRAKEIGPDYSGCQTTWVADGARWKAIVKTEILSGDPVRIWLPDGTYAACRYRNGKVVSGNKADCAHPDFLLAKSFPPGCVAKLRNAAAKDVPGVLPVGCDFE